MYEFETENMTWDGPTQFESFDEAFHTLIRFVYDRRVQEQPWVQTHVMPHRHGLVAEYEHRRSNPRALVRLVRRDDE